MTTLEIWLSIILYIIMGIITNHKIQESGEEDLSLLTFGSIFWPISLLIMIVYQTFFKKWD